MKNYMKKIILGMLVLVAISLGATVFAFERSKIDILPQNDFVVEPGKTEIFVNPNVDCIAHICILNVNYHIFIPLYHHYHYQAKKVI